MRKLTILCLALLLPLAAFALSVPDNARIRNLNVINNPGFESGSAGYTASGVTITIVTTGTNKLFDGVSAAVDFTASSQYVETNAISIPEGLKGAACTQEIYYKGADTNVKVSVYDHTPAEVASSAVTLTAASVATKARVDFTCPTGATMRLRIASLGNAAVAAFDSLYLGARLITSGSGTNLAVTQQIFTSGSGTYTTPAPTPLYLEVEACGGGGGGGGAGGGSTAGSGGASTTFGSSLITAGAGGGGDAAGGSGGASGTSTISSPAIGDTMSGERGGEYTNSAFPSEGGSSALYAGRGAGGTIPATAGVAGIVNTGGGGGGGSGTVGVAGGGLGGGGGGCVRSLVSTPSATYSYAVGAGGSAGSAGGSGGAGGAGGSGKLVVTEHYQ